MVIFYTDLDNTLIYSYKHEIGQEKTCVEMYENREVSYISKKTRYLLEEVAKNILVVPTTTRSVEQYNRIRLGLGSFPYALVCNGGVLLENGTPDLAWQEESLALARPGMGELEKAASILQNDPARCLDIRMIEGLFLFTKSSQPELSAGKLSECLDNTLVDVFCNGTKLYVLPKKLDKGTALKRFKQRMGADRAIAAGDSLFDIPMLEAADVAVAPAALGFCASRSSNRPHPPDQLAAALGGETLFSESMLEYVLDHI